MKQREQDSLLSDDTVRHIAHLARIAITQSEVTKAKDDLTAIFNHIDLLNSIDTDGVAPLDHPTELINATRADSAGESLTQEQVLANAPATKDMYFDVPKVLGVSE